MASRTTKAQAQQDDAQESAPVSGSEETAPPTGEEIAETVRTGNVLAQRNDAAMQTFMTWVTQRADTTDDDQYAIMASVMGEIMTSNNVASLMEERAPLHARDVVGRPLILFGFEIREGQYEDSAIGFYAALTCGRAGSDETRVITCGGMKVLAKLMMLEMFIERDDNDDTWPQPIVFTEKQTRKGYGVLDIVRPAITTD
jgi:hypothetical protein